MWMEEILIERLYKAAADPIKEIIVLSECNDEPLEKIVDILSRRKVLNKKEVMKLFENVKHKKIKKRERTVWTPEKLERLKSLLQSGLSVCEISAKMGVSIHGLYSVMHKKGLKVKRS